MTNKYIVLDRDGVINEESPNYIKAVDELKTIKGSPEAISELTKAGYLIFVVTNQSGIGRGLTTADNVKEINMKIASIISDASGSVEQFYYCPHLPTDGCKCRKPKTGLLKQIEKDYLIRLKGSFFVGDSVSDVMAARAHSMVPLLVRTGYGKKTELTLSSMNKKNIFSDLLCAVRERILKIRADG